MVVSHDCDLAVEDLLVEPFVEVLIGTRIGQCDPNMMHTKNPRTLHLEFDRGDTRVGVELRAAEKKLVDKRDLADKVPDPAYSLDAKGAETLQSWMSARYRRAAIPDDLQRLVKDIFQDVGKKNPRALHGIWVAYEPESDTLPEGERYELFVTIVYATGVLDAKTVGEDAAKQVKEKFERKYRKEGAWSDVELRECVARADTEFTYFDVLRKKRFRLEYLSLRETPTAETGER